MFLRNNNRLGAACYDQGWLTVCSPEESAAQQVVATQSGQTTQAVSLDKPSTQQQAALAEQLRQTATQSAAATGQPATTEQLVRTIMPVPARNMFASQPPPAASAPSASSDPWSGGSGGGSAPTWWGWVQSEKARPWIASAITAGIIALLTKGGAS